MFIDLSIRLAAESTELLIWTERLRVWLLEPNSVGENVTELIW